MSKIFLLFLWLFVLGLLHKSVVLGCMNAHYVYKRYKSKNFYSYSLKFKRSGVLSEVHYKIMLYGFCSRKPLTGSNNRIAFDKNNFKQSVECFQGLTLSLTCSVEVQYGVRH